MGWGIERGRGGRPWHGLERDIEVIQGDRDHPITRTAASK